MPNSLLNDTNLASVSAFLHSSDAVISISDAQKIYFLNEAITAPAGIRILVGLTNAVIPNSIYNISSTNNSIVISGQTYTIEAGNYSAKDLATTLSFAITAVGSVTFNDQNNVFLFNFTTAQTIDSTTMERQLGLKNQLPTASATVYKCEGSCDLGGTTNIYFRLSNLTLNNLDSRGKSTNIIANIVNQSNYGDFIFYTPPENNYYLVNETNISHLDIELTDQDGTLLDLNGCDYNITLTFHFVKERESLVKASLLKQIQMAYDVKKKDRDDEKNKTTENKNVDK